MATQKTLLLLTLILLLFFARQVILEKLFSVIEVGLGSMEGVESADEQNVTNEAPTTIFNTSVTGHDEMSSSQDDVSAKSNDSTLLLNASSTPSHYNTETADENMGDTKVASSLPPPQSITTAADFEFVQRDANIYTLSRDIWQLEEPNNNKNSSRNSTAPRHNHHDIPCNEGAYWKFANHGCCPPERDIPLHVNAIRQVEKEEHLVLWGFYHSTIY